MSGYSILGFTPELPVAPASISGSTHFYNGNLCTIESSLWITTHSYQSTSHLSINYNYMGGDG